MSVDSSDVVGDSVSGGVKGGLVESDGNTDDGDEELADEHTESSVDEERATTESLDSVEGDRGGADVDDGEDHGDEERVGDSTSRSEERSGVVEAVKRSEESESDIDHSRTRDRGLHEVDSGPLLHHLEGSTEDSATKVGASIPERSREASSPGSEP